MRAVVYKKYGDVDVLKLKCIEKPVPKEDEVLIKVAATSVTAGDWRLRKADPFLARLFNGIFSPKRIKILGLELSGVVVETGKNVSLFKKGDEVFGFCGFKFGGYAEYRSFSENDIITRMPPNITFEEAATIPLSGLTALAFLRKSQISEGQHILIYGASGSVGTYAVQLANFFDADVTAVCSTKNIELVKAIGANEVVDYIKTGFTKLDKKFDIIFDAVGKINKSSCRHLLKPDGRYVSVKGRIKPVKADLVFIKELIEAGKLKAVIDSIYNLETIQEAHQYVEQFRKRGNVAVRVI